MKISKNTIYSICISIGFIIFAFIINVYLCFIILLSFLPALPTLVRKKDNDLAKAVYTRKDFLTYNEKLFYRKLLPLSNMQRNRKIRDNKIKNILKDCNIPLLTFYTSYSNEESYVVNRIKQVLNSRF